MPRAHLEAAKGTPEQAAAYCKKTAIVGTRRTTKSRKRSDLDDIRELLKTSSRMGTS